MRAVIGLAWVAALAFATRLALGPGFANYDTFYGLVWGAELASGEIPDYHVPIAPTPKPLINAAGILLSPLGHGAETAVVVIAFLSVGALGYLTYRLGAEWFGAGAGVVAAAIILTREPVLSFGVRAYVDVPYVALVLGALLVETRRPVAGPPVLALLGVAGLLRPEAWLLAAAYLVYIAIRDGRGRAAKLLPLAAAAPLIWALGDLLVAGEPFHSLLDTRATGQLLERRTGIGAIPSVLPRRLGEILREPVLLGAAGGGLLSLAFLRPRATLPATVGIVAVLAFCAFAVAGLPILGRYLLLPAALLAVFAGAGVTGWRRLPQGHRARRPWAAFAAVTALVFAAFAPAQIERVSELRASLGEQEAIRDDLHRLADGGLFASACEPVAVPNHRPVPLLALWLDRRPATIISAQLRRPERGYFLAPANERVETAFVLDPKDPRRLGAAVPPAFRRGAANRSWNLYARCPTR